MMDGRPDFAITLGTSDIPERQSAPLATGLPMDQSEKSGRKPGKNYDTKNHLQPQQSSREDSAPERLTLCQGELSRQGR